MANPYYTFTDSFTPGQRARSGDLDREYQAIEVGFDNLPADATAITKGTATYAGLTTGAADAYVAAPPDARAADADGDEIVFICHATNTMASTLNVDGNGVKAIVRADGAALVANDLIVGLIYAARFDSANTRWQLTTPNNSFLVDAAASAAASLASAVLSAASAGLAATSETNAAASEVIAGQWAIHPEDDDLDSAPGQFSALHWAAKSAASALSVGADNLYYAGEHDASTGAPSTPVAKALYKITAEGTFDSVDWNPGDEAYYDGASWTKMGPQLRRGEDYESTASGATGTGVDWYVVAEKADVGEFGAGTYEITVATDGSGGTDDMQPLVAVVSRTQEDSHSDSEWLVHYVSVPYGSVAGITGARVAYDAASDTARFEVEVDVGVSATNLFVYVRNMLSRVASASPHSPWLAVTPSTSPGTNISFTKDFAALRTRWGLQGYRSEMFWEGSPNNGVLRLENFSGTSELQVRRIAGDDGAPAAQLELQYEGGIVRWGSASGFGAVEIGSQSGDVGLRFPNATTAGDIRWEGSTTRSGRIGFPANDRWQFLSEAHGGVIEFAGENNAGTQIEMLYIDPENTNVDVKNGAALRLLNSGETSSGSINKGTNLNFTTTAGDVVLAPATGVTQFFVSGTDSIARLYGGAGANYFQAVHDDTNATISTNSGRLDISPSGNIWLNSNTHVRNGGSFFVFNTGSTESLELLHDGTQAIIRENTAGQNLRLQTTALGEIDLYANNELTFQAVGDGTVHIVGDANSDTDQRLLILRRPDAGQMAYFGQLAGDSDLVVRNLVHGGRVLLNAEDTGGALVSMGIFDPDGSVTLYHDAGVGLRTSSHTASDINMGAQVFHRDGSWYAAGIHNMPVHEADDSTDHNDDVNIGKILHKDSGTPTYTVDQNTDVQVGACWMIANEAGGNISLNQGSGVALRWFDGGGGAVTAGNRTLGTGAIVTLYKYTDIEYWCWGSGIS